MAKFITFSLKGMQKIFGANGGITFLNSGLLVCLYNGAADPNGALLIGQFVECNWKGYARAAMPIYVAPAANGLNQNVDLIPSPILWSYNSAGAGANTRQTIDGWFVTDAGFTEWYFGSRTNIAPAAVLDADGKSYQLTPTVTGGPYLQYP